VIDPGEGEADSPATAGRSCEPITGWMGPRTVATRRRRSLPVGTVGRRWSIRIRTFGGWISTSGSSGTWKWSQTDSW